MNTIHTNTTQRRISIRCFDVAPLPTKNLDPIQGFEKEPLVSLEAAIEPLVDTIPDVERMISGIKPLCIAPTDNLSIDEFASIMFYTLEWNPPEKSFYIILNEKLRCENRQELLSLFRYLRLFTFALSKLPSIINQTIYRGVKRDISNQYKIGDTCVWWSFSSCSSSINIIEQFLGKTGPRTLFIITSYTGKNISQHSYHPIEDEILILTGTYFKILANIDQGDDLHIIQLEEIQPSKSSIPSRNQSLIDQIDKYSIHSEIDLRGQKLIDEDIEIVIEKAIINKKCSQLHLQNNLITSQGTSIIALGLKDNITLHKLWLDSNNISDNGIHSLSKILSYNNFTLKMIGLNSNNITDEGAKYIAEILKTNKILTFISLSHNLLTNQGVQLITDVLIHHNNTLESIDLSSNKLVTDVSIDYLIQMIIHNQKLSSLSISNCGLSENGKDKIRSMGQAKYGFKLSL